MIATGWARVALGIILIAGLALGLAACDQADDEPVEGVHVVTTIPPFQAILEPIVGERGTVDRLVEAGDSPHTYEPRPSDLRHVEGSTVLFYGAPHLDEWAADLPAPERVALLDMVPEVFWHPLLGHHHGSRDEDESESIGVDPHFWTDPLAVKAILPAVADTLCAHDPAGCDTYAANAEAFADELDALHAELNALLDPVRSAPVLLSQPFFQYFLNRYDIELVGVVEPNPAHEPTARYIQTTVNHARDHDVRAILSLPQLRANAAEAVSESADVPIVQLDPLGGVDERRTYDELLRYNARILAETLD